MSSISRSPPRHRIRVDCAATPSPNGRKSPYANPKSPISSKNRTPAKGTKKYGYGQTLASPKTKRTAVSVSTLSPQSAVRAQEIGQGLFSPAAWRKSGTCSQNVSRDPSQNLESTKIVHNEEFLEAYMFMKHLPPLPIKYRTRKPHLPPKPKNAPKYTLVLDLDETLVHCSVEPCPKYDLIFPVKFNGINYKVYMSRRPHLEKFLKEVSKTFEVIVFTASQRVYGDKVLNIIDPNGEYIKHRLFRDSCVHVEGNFLKHLEVLNRDLSTTFIIDNSPQAFAYQIENGIPIVSWFDDQKDRELTNMLDFLSNLRQGAGDDVRPFLKKKFGLRKVINNVPDDFMLE